MSCDNLGEQNVCQKFGVKVISDICRICKEDEERVRAILTPAMILEKQQVILSKEQKICYGCEWFRSCCGFCVLLTRHTKMSDVWKNGRCPEDKWAKIILEKPKKNGAKGVVEKTEN